MTGLVIKVRKLPVGWWVWRGHWLLGAGGWCPTRAVKEHQQAKLREWR